MPEQDPDPENFDMNKTHQNIMSEIKVGHSLDKPDEAELKTGEELRVKRLEKIKKLQNLFENAQTMMSEIQSSHVILQPVPEEEKFKYQQDKEKRLETITKLRENIDLTSELIKEINEKTPLKSISEEDRDKYEANKVKRMEMIKKANKQLTSFTSVLDEITVGSNIPLKSIDPQEQAEYEKKKAQRIENVKRAGEHLTAFGTLLGEITSETPRLKKIDEADKNAHEQAKIKRMEEIQKIKKRIELASGLIDDIVSDLTLQPEQKEGFKTELLERFEVASSYINRIEKEKGEKFQEMTGLKNSMKKIPALFEEMKGQSLKPVDPEEKVVHEKAKSERMVEIDQIKKTVLAKMDLTTSLMDEIHSIPTLQKISSSVMEKYKQEKSERHQDAIRMGSHLTVIEELIQKTRDGIQLEKPDAKEIDNHDQARKDRLEELSSIKTKLDVLGELVEKSNQGIVLDKIDERDLLKYEEEKKARMEEIRQLKEKIDKMELPKEDAN
ncbi:MAG: hypothetical protein ACTSRK_12895 [Promethearchaeota archaeon]